MPPGCPQKDLIEGATKSRSNLAKAFDELNAQKSRRSALQANLKGLALQMHESQSEIKEISTRIEGLGTVSFDESKLKQVELALKALTPLVLEYAGLCMRLEDLPGLEVEIARQQSELAALKERQGQLIGQIEALGYRESDYIEARKRQVTLKPLHDRFLSHLGEGGTNSRLKGENKRARGGDREAQPETFGSAKLTKGTRLRTFGV